MMMLAPPLYSQSALSDDSYRPAKDIDAFNSLLPPPIEFIEGSSSSSLAVAQGKYDPINASPKPSKFQEKLAKSSSSAPSTPTPAKSTKPATVTPKTPKFSLHSADIDFTWPRNTSIGTGLLNIGNTCFLNSALQCLLHTPPLLHVLSSHKPDSCKAKASHSFCMTCNLREVAHKSHSTNRAYSPIQITSRLQTIAKHMRKGRQEDSHEFLRYAVDALQKSCLAGLPPKIDPKLAETTWVHKIFGGRLRSRVTCGSCGHNSDTFDSILDLSIDIHHSSHLKDALRRFVAPDYLKGADKYKCEKCNKHVNAEKRFSIHDAPPILTIQLKRFSPFGQKISQTVNYDESLNISPYMSEHQFGGQYSLYGVICHLGGGPHSGHYYAFVKSNQTDKKWYEMNDESVTPLPRSPTGLKNAYILFYMRNRGQMLKEAVRDTGAKGIEEKESALLFTPTQVQKSSIAASMKTKINKKRLREDDEKENGNGNDGDEDKGVKVDNKPFIGPQLPSSLLNGSRSRSRSRSRERTPESESNKRQKTTHTDNNNEDDPQATSVKRKIDALKAKTNGVDASPSAKLKAMESLSSLKGYASDSDGEEESTKVNGHVASGSSPERGREDGHERDRETTPPRSTITSTATTSTSTSKPWVPAPISPSRFFSNSNSKAKRRRDDRDRDSLYSNSHSPSHSHSHSSSWTSKQSRFDPYARLSGGGFGAGGGGRQKTYGRRFNKKARGI